MIDSIKHQDKENFGRSFDF